MIELLPSRCTGMTLEGRVNAVRQRVAAVVSAALTLTKPVKEKSDFSAS